MLNWEETLLRLVTAAVFGGLVGLERQRNDWAAGLRTHMIVCIGASLMMIVSSFGFSDILGTPNVSLDPSRVAAQVVSGIGFLGAGTILFLKNEVIKGLTTAAGLWTVAGIGLAVGGGLYFAAAATTAIVLIILVIIKPYKNKLLPQNKQKEMFLQVNKQLVSIRQIEHIVTEQNLKFSQITMRPSDNGNLYAVDIRFNKSIATTTLLTVIDELNKLNGIIEAKLQAD